MKTKIVSFFLVVSSLAWGQIPDTLEIKSGPAGISTAITFLPFVVWKRTYDPFEMEKMEFREPFGMNYKGGDFNSHRFLLNGIPVNNGLYNDIPLTDAILLPGFTDLAGKISHQSSGILQLIQKTPGKSFTGHFEVSGGTYLSVKDELYPQKSKLDNLGNTGLRFSVSGPVPGTDNLVFLASGMLSNDAGYLSGRDYYQTWNGIVVSDGSKVLPSGDSSAVLMNSFNRRSFNLRFLREKKFISTDFFILYNRKSASYYSFDWFLTPDGNLKHYQEQLISGLTLTARWSKKFSQYLRLSYQPAQTWGNIHPDINSSAYSTGTSSLYYDPDQFYSQGGGNDNRRYRYQDNLFLSSLENIFQWTDNQKTFLSVQAENWWYYEEKGKVFYLDENVNEMYFFGGSLNRHPSLYSVAAGHRSCGNLFGFDSFAEAGVKSESFKAGADQVMYSTEMETFSDILSATKTGKTIETKTEFLPYLATGVQYKETLFLWGGLNYSAEWPTHSLLFSIPQRLNEYSYSAGNPDLDAVKWLNSEFGVSWLPVSWVKITLDGFSRKAFRFYQRSIGFTQHDRIYFQEVSDDITFTVTGMRGGLKIGAPLRPDFLLSKLNLDLTYTRQTHRFRYHRYIDLLDEMRHPVYESPYLPVPVVFQASLHAGLFTGTSLKLNYRVRSGESYPKSFRDYRVYVLSMEEDPVGRAPAFGQADLELVQEIKTRFGLATIFLAIENVSDQQSILNLYPQTGKADLKEDEYFIRTARNTYRRTGAENPDFYSPPRKITAGFSFQF